MLRSHDTLDLLLKAADIALEEIDEDELRELAKDCGPAHVQGIQRVIQVHERLLSFVHGGAVN